MNPEPRTPNLELNTNEEPGTLNRERTAFLRLPVREEVCRDVFLDLGLVGLVDARELQAHADAAVGPGDLGIGVAMGAAGSDVAIETADVALMSDELLKLPFAVRLARATLRNVKTNVAVSLLLKAAFLVMALLGSATLWMAVLADTGASVIVVANALRLLRER